MATSTPFTVTRPGIVLADFAFSSIGPNTARMSDFEEKSFEPGGKLDGLVIRVTLALTAAADARVWLFAETSGKRAPPMDQATLFVHEPAWSVPPALGPSWHLALPASDGVASRTQTRLVVPLPQSVTRLRCATDAAGAWTIEGQVAMLRGVLGPC